MALSPESFDRLLNWLHPDRKKAGQEYQRIRTLLIGHFQAKGCPDPDELTDAAMDRVAEKLKSKKIQNWVEGEKAKYFFRVAYWILREDKNKRRLETQIPEEFEIPNAENEDLEPESYCLEKCLQKLSTTDRELIERYYFEEKAKKKKNRADLARELNIDLPKLRVRAHRIRQQLRVCIEKCLQEAEKSRVWH